MFYSLGNVLTMLNFFVTLNVKLKSGLIYRLKKLVKAKVNKSESTVPLTICAAALLSDAYLKAL